MRVTKNALYTGRLGLKVKTLPSGAYLVKEDETGLTLHDETMRLQWSFTFFENLFMDLNETTFDHLRDDMEVYARAMFEDDFRQYRGTSQGGKSTRMLPKTREEPNWSPIVDVEWVNIPCKMNDPTSDYDSDTTLLPTVTPALVVVHRLAYRHDEETVMARLMLPVKRGLCEIVIAARGTGNGLRQTSILAAECKQHVNPMKKEDIITFLKTRNFDSEYYDKIVPSHCLSRVRSALRWLLDESGLKVMEPPSIHQRRQWDEEKWVRPLKCNFVPPPRFIHCPDPKNPDSDKQRFCRVNFGGTVGVQVLVISRWSYFFTACRTMEGLRQLANEGAMTIHESQNYVDISIAIESFSSIRDWFGGRDRRGVVFTWVDCYDQQGNPYQHVVGWTREPSSGAIFLVYLTDIMGLSRDKIREELIAALKSVRTSSRRVQALKESKMAANRNIPTQHRHGRKHQVV